LWRISAFDRDGREIGHFEIEAGELTVGRDADRQLVLPSASVSRRHARVVIQDGRPCIIDEGSSNGVLVNGVRITAPTAIGASTRIDLAEFRIAIEPVMPTEAVAPIVAPPALAQPGGMRLIAEGGPFDGRVFSLPPGVLAVGRAVDNDLVFDDPSLSRKHARIHREAGRMEVEDLGSSNGTFVNNRKIGRSVASPGDVVRFGDLNFRVEGGEYGSTRSVEPGLPGWEALALLGGGAVTLILVLCAIVFLIRKVPPVQASGKDAIARIAHQADLHLKNGRALYQQRKYADAKIELDSAVDLDPANAEARRLRTLATHGPEDDRALQSASGAMAIGDRKGLESALRLYAEMTDGASQRAQLVGKLVPALERFGDDRLAAHAWADSAWAICRAYEIAPAAARPDGHAARTLHEAERKLRHDHTYQPCAAAH
jgi:pSer/pThr/pTyr-binding forkhead associated (FHA) protein